jgi:hypothetical protein
MTGILLTGCGKTSDQKIDSVKETVGGATQELKQARTAYLAEWETFKRESELVIAANEKRIDAFKETIAKAGSQVKAKYDKDVVILEQKNEDLKKKLAEYKDEGGSTWEEFKTDFKHDMDGLGKTMTDLIGDKG